MRIVPEGDVATGNAKWFGPVEWVQSTGIQKSKMTFAVSRRLPLQHLGVGQVGISHDRTQAPDPTIEVQMRCTAV